MRQNRPYAAKYALLNIFANVICRARWYEEHSPSGEGAIAVKEMWVIVVQCVCKQGKVQQMQLRCGPWIETVDAVWTEDKFSVRTISNHIHYP